MIHKSLLLTGLAIAPSLAQIPVQSTNVNTNTLLIDDMQEDEIQEQEESCTVMYVGKKVSDTGKTYCCRCGDSTPRCLNMNATMFEHNQLANQVVKGKNGFEWKMPSTTYKYISTPRNTNVRNGLHWEVSAINEMGVACSATLSCYANKAALEADPYEDVKGISEDNLAQIMGATSTTAREAMETIAKILDKKGSAEGNIIMAMDKDEAWLMEIYTGHQYCAIKLPEDKACTIGNEFFLDTLKDFKQEDIIASPKLLTLPKEHGFAKTTEGYLDLYRTYAGDKKAGAPEKFNDRSHMRTWRGRSLFMNDPEVYDSDTKYEPFFTPKRKLSVSDIISFFRDRFESILNNDQDPNYQKFKDAYDARTLRWVGDSSTYQVHIMSVNADLPKEIAAEETIAFASANYTPFIPLNAGVTTMDKYYTHVTKDWGYDEESAYYIFKRLNGVADLDRTNYGLPIENYFANHEAIWQIHYNELLQQIKTQSLDVQRNVLTNYCTWLQTSALAASDALFNELIWHILNAVPQGQKLFVPFVSVEYYSYLYGWDYSKNGDIATLKHGNDTIKIDYSYTEKPATGWIIGKLSINDEQPIGVRVTVKDDNPCLDVEDANKYIAADHELVPIKWQDYFTGNDRPSWVIPVAITIPIVVILAAVAPIAAVASSKKKKGIDTQA